MSDPNDKRLQLGQNPPADGANTGASTGTANTRATSTSGPHGGDANGSGGSATEPRKDNRLTHLAYAMVLLGALLLVARLGWFDLSFLLGIARYWPVLVIAAGVDLLTRGRWRVPVYAAGIGVALLLSFTGGWFGAANETVEVAQELQGARSADVYIASGIANLELTGAPQSAYLATGSLGQHAGERVSVEYDVRAGRGDFRATSRGRSIMGPRRAEDWDLALTDRIPLALSVDAGIGGSTLDLRRLQLESLQVNAGIGETTLLLPGRGGFRGDIDGGIGEIVMRVPRSLGIRIHVDTGIGNVSVDGHFTKDGDTYTSPAYAASSQRVDLTVDGGIGSIRIEATN